MKQISIVGTGWLGLPVSKTLLQENYQVKGSTTSSDRLKILQSEGIVAYKILLEEEGPLGDIKDFLFGSTLLIINIPPGLRKNPESNFVAKIQKLIPYIETSSIQQVLFISSSAVFKDEIHFPIITSKTKPNAESNSGRQLIATEQLLLNNDHFETTILRFGGLYDKRRHPASILSKRSNIKNPLAPLNLIHIDDCIGIIKKIVEIDYYDQVFNAACPEHPTKMAYYTKVCRAMEIPIPDYDMETLSIGKIIDPTDLRTILDYKFRVSL